MSRTIRRVRGNNYNDGDVSNPEKDKKPVKRFMYPGEGWSCKSNGGVGNKRGWKPPIPKWLYKKLKSNPTT